MKLNETDKKSATHRSLVLFESHQIQIMSALIKYQKLTSRLEGLIVHDLKFTVSRYRNLKPRSNQVSWCTPRNEYMKLWATTVNLNFEGKVDLISEDAFNLVQSSAKINKISTYLF